MNNISVAAITATYGRPRELERLLRSLAEVGEGLSAIVVVDNAGSDEVRALVEQAGDITHYVNPGSNLGCGGGLSLGEERALEIGGRDLTHILILDDDVVLERGTISLMARAMEEEKADLGYPLVVNDEGKVGWLPLMPNFNRRMRRKSTCSPEEFRARFGMERRSFVCTPGICLLVTRSAIERWGRHRTDFWIRGEDIEFSRRLTAHAKGIFVPSVVARHLPPPSADAAQASDLEYLKHCALVQNMSLIGLRLPHGLRLAWTVLPTYRYFFRLWSWRGVGDAFRALWRGAVLGEAAGAGTGQTFHARFMDRLRAK